MHQKRAEDFGNLKKVDRVETRHRTRSVYFRLLAEALGRYRTRWGANEKARIERLYLSLSLCWKTFKVKGNKKFRTWTERSLRVFRISRFQCSMLYIYEHYMSISHIRIWLCNWCIKRLDSSVDCGCRIHRLHFCREVRPLPNECPVYNTRQSDDKAPVMQQFWGLWSTPSLPSLPGQLWPRVLAPGRVLLLGHIEMFDI